MRKKSLLNELDSLLRPLGFLKNKDCFIRVVGDGILQGIWVCRNRFMINSNCIDIDLCSVYENKKQVFADAGLGTMARSQPVNRFEEFMTKTERPDRKIDVSIPDTEHLEILTRTCLPAMEDIITQRKLCEMKAAFWDYAGDEKSWNEGRAWHFYRDKVIPLIRERRYEEALDAVAYVISVTYIPEMVMNEMVKLRDHLAQGDTEFLTQYMENNKKENLEIIQKLFK